MVYTVKIVSMAVMERAHGNSQVPRVFGVGENGQVYEWNYAANGWDRFTSIEG